MSRETLEWLNSNTLIGFTEKRGHAWHYRAGADNHYAGAIPVADVHSRLFNWSPLSVPLFVNVPCDFGTMTGIGDNGMPYRTAQVPARQAMVRSDTGAVLGIFSDGYAAHPYGEWLVNAVSTIIGDTLAVGSAGLLDGGGIAWVQVEVPESITTPEGVQFRPNLLATTSLNGKVATTYKRVFTNVVCDNTHAMALGEAGQAYKLKHTRYSTLKLGDARAALAMVETATDDFMSEVKALCEETVTDAQWFRFLNAYSPIPDDKGRGRTMAQDKQGALTKLYRHDNRVAPWNGTAWGVVQAVNTFVHHEGIVRGAGRVERNMMRMVTSDIDKLDADTLKVLASVR